MRKDLRTLLEEANSLDMELPTAARVLGDCGQRHHRAPAHAAEPGQCISGSGVSAPASRKSKSQPSFAWVMCCENAAP